MKSLKEYLIDIREDFYKGEKSRGSYREIFINPSWKEIKDASESIGDFQWEGNIRFFAFFDIRDLFVFPADMLHPDAKKYIDREFTDNYLEGIGEVKGRKVIIDRDRLESLNDELMGWVYEVILEGKLDWLDRYNFDIKELKRDLNGLDEEYVTSFKRGGEVREIFKNPDRKEIQEVSQQAIPSNKGYIRFIAMKDERDVYIGGLGVMHSRIAKEVGIDRGYYREDFPGVGKVERGEIVITEFGDFAIDYDNYLKSMCLDIVNGEYDWLEKYHFDLSVIKEKSEKEVKRMREEGVL